VPLLHGRWWLLAAAAIGVVPVLIASRTGGAWHQLASAFLLFPLFLAAVREDRTVRGLAVVGLCFAAHNAAAIGLSASSAEFGALFPDGPEYWAKQQVWITTGTDPEYQVMNWLPAHLQLFAGIVLYCFLSLGFVAFIQGFYEVDLMNFYVGRLIASSDSVAPALLLGWHPWSALRGLCYLLLVWEVASWSLERMTGRTLSTPERRMGRWLAACGFFVADCVVKLAILEPVRRTLADNLSAPL